MSAEKLSISFDEETIARARRAAARNGVPLSTWIARAARRNADLDEAAAALAEHFSEYGEPTADAQQWADVASNAAGVGSPETDEEFHDRQRALATLDKLAAMPDTVDEAGPAKP